MQDSSSTDTGSPGPLRSANGQVEALDRSYLLRRAARFPFPLPLKELKVVRMRRERRVFSSFSAIPPLARRRKD